MQFVKTCLNILTLSEHHGIFKNETLRKYSVKMASSCDLTKTQLEVNANYKPVSESPPSFARLAALAKTQESTVAKSCGDRLPEDVLLKDVFRIPQTRNDRISSYDEGDEDHSRELLAELVNDDESYDLPEDEGTETTDMKPSLFNFRGYVFGCYHYAQKL